MEKQNQNKSIDEYEKMVEMLRQIIGYQEQIIEQQKIQNDLLKQRLERFENRLPPVIITKHSNFSR